MIFMLISVIGSFQIADVYAATSITNVLQTPWIISDNGTLKSETRLTINNADSAYSGWVKISVTGKAAYMESIGTISSGVNTKTVHVAELVNDGDGVTFQIYDNSSGNGTPKAEINLAQKKVRHWRIYVAHDMHTDVGYTDYQETLKSSTFPGYLDSAFTYISNTNSWTDDNKFRYPVEESFMLYDSALTARNADWIQTLKANVANGRLTYPYSYANMAAEGMGSEELARQNYYSARYLKDILGTGPTKVVVHTDDPGFPWSNIDTLAGAGVKYASLRFNDTFWNLLYGHNPYYPRIFYLRGMNPDNKLLVQDGPKYDTDDYKFRNTDSSITFESLSTKLLDRQTTDYPYDALLLQMTNNRDNDYIEPNIMNNIKTMNEKTDSSGRDYVYPQFRNSNEEDFFSYIETNYAASIPTFQGTIENMWNFGAAQQSQSTSLSKTNHETVPAAEFFSLIANIAAPYVKYPTEEILQAYNDLMLTDEHTWAAMTYNPDDFQIKWKRNKAIDADRIADKVMNSAFGSIDSAIPTTGKTIVVYNDLSWIRSDLVSVKQSDLPEHFDITDKVTGLAIKYQKLTDGTVVFVAPTVPQYGYKCFDVTTRTEDPTFATSITTTSNTIENNYFRVTFDTTGSISSVIDKQNSNREMVDSSAPYKMNQFLYCHANTNSALKHSVSQAYKIEEASLSSSVGGIMGTMTSTGYVTGTNGVKRNIILYDAIPRIDIVNEVQQQDRYTPVYYEDMFFSFPFAVDNFMIRHGTPTGDIRPYVDSNINNPTDQIYYSTTDFYTVNNWIDLSNQNNYGIVFSPLNAPIVQYGDRRSFAYDKNYNTAKPWVNSWVYNNYWSTNYQMAQPGSNVFRYSISSHTGADWTAGRADKTGLALSHKMQTSVIAEAQTGNFSGTQGEFLNLDKDNVVLTAGKVSEANGEGMILRFLETKGEDTTVTVDFSGYLIPSEVYQTDLVENDLSQLTLTNQKVTFTIKGHDWYTIRLKRGSAPAQVTGAAATMNSSGTLVSWNALNDTSLCYYEVFRDVTSGFTPGSGNYISSTSKNFFYDKQVKSGLTNTYYYKIRAVNHGKKGTASTYAQSVNGTITDTTAPSAPSNLKAEVLSPNWISLTWSTSTDNLLGVKGYKVYKNGSEMTDIPAFYCSYLDVVLATNTTCQYTVRAYDEAGNLSAQSNTVSATTIQSYRDGNIAPLATVTASSYSQGFSPSMATDGILMLQGTSFGEWASNGEVNPWIKLEWSSRKAINKIRFSDRANNTDNVRDGTLLFSDGTSIDVHEMDVFGRPAEVSFDTKYVTWVKFQVTNGQGSNVGLSEIQVIEANAARETHVTASSQQSYLPPEGATDGVIGVHDSGEWASNETNPWIELDLHAGRKINRIVLYDRVNLLDNAREGTLTFSDGSSIAVTGIPDDGTAKEIVFKSKVVTWVRFQVTGGSGPRIGLSELQLFDDNIACQAAITASSYSGGFTPDMTADNIIYESYGEWASNAELNPWVQYTWTTRKIVDRVILYDRKNTTDDANAGILRFSDGSTITVTGIPKDGTPREIRFLPKSVTCVRFETTDGSGMNVGLSEVQIYEVNASTYANISASSYYNNDWLPSNVADGIVGSQNYGEWCSNGEQSPWIRFDWENVKNINRLLIYDRPGNDDANSGILTFSDGTSIEVTGIPTDGSAKVIDFPTKNVYWMKFQVTGGVGPHVGLNEIEALDMNMMYNATCAQITASSYYNSDWLPSNVADGIIGVANYGEWCSNAEQNPWIQLNWEKTKFLNTVVLYDRPGNDNANSGTLTFSDGSSISVTGIPTDGSAKTITFSTKKVTWMKFQITGGVGPNVGMNEIKAYDSNLAYDATITSSSEQSGKYKPAQFISDGIIAWDNVGEWCANETYPWVRYTWPTAVNINKIVLYDNQHPGNNARTGTLTFSDGTSMTVTGIPDNGEEKEITFSTKTVTWVKFQVTGGLGGYVGLSEFQIFGN